MNKKHNITETEWPILEVLWERGPVTAADIYKTISARHEVTEKTMKSLIRRLISKNMVGFTVDSRDSRIYHYRALIDQESCLKEKSDSMLQLLYGGRIAKLFEHFVKDLSPDEVSHIEQLLAQRKKERKN